MTVNQLKTTKVTCACCACFAGVVYEVIKRRSEMVDPPVANLDLMIVVMSLEEPPFDVMQATRFLVSAEAANIPAMLLLNKADLVEDEITQALVSEVQSILLITTALVSFN